MEPASPVRQLLLVEDDEAFRRVLRSVFENFGFKVTEAPNGRAALGAFMADPKFFDIVVSDVRMPEMTGIELLKAIRAVDRRVRFVVMTGFTEILEARQAFEFGASEFLAKPFRIETVRAVIQHCFDGRDKRRAQRDDPSQFSQISVEEFLRASKLTVDLYLRLSAEKFIKIAHAGDELDVARLKSYKEKKVDFFFVRAAETLETAGFGLTSDSSADPAAAAETRRQLLESVTELIKNTALFSHIERTALSSAAKTLRDSLNVVTHNQEVLGLLTYIMDEGIDAFTHAVAAALCSCLTAKQLSVPGDDVQMRLTMAGMLHDIGKKVLTPEEMKNHPTEGREILLRIPGMPQDVIQIVGQHHEILTGKGFPHQLKSAQIHPLAKIMGAVNCFLGHLKATKKQDKESVHEALRQLNTVNAPDYERQIILALAQVFGAEAVVAQAR